MATKKTTSKKPKLVYSKNKKLNYVLKDIHKDLNELGESEVKRYIRENPREPDHNIYMYGNMRIYYDEIRDLYRKAGYAESTLKRMDNQKLSDTYARQVGYVARNYPIKKRKEY